MKVLHRTLCMSALYQVGSEANFPMESMTSEILERVKGIEPSYEAWEAAVLPLNYTREPSGFYRCSVCVLGT